MGIKRRKILYVVEAMGGGVFTFLVGLCNELVKDYDIYVAYGMRRQTPDDFSKYFDDRIHLIRVRHFERAIRLRNDASAFLELKRIEERIKPDIIHLHSSKAGALGRWAYNGKKIPLFYTPHGYSFLMSNYDTVRLFSYKMVERFSAHRTCTTISCSEGEHRETLRMTKNALFVNNGIDIDEIQRMMDEIGPVEEGEFNVFTLGRICYQKNPRLFNEIASKMPDVRFVWIGDGDLKKELTAPNIEVTGWLSREEALRRAMSSNAFVLTSLWEGLPMSLLEAMYMEKLCLVNDVIGSRDVIRTGVNGYVCKSADDFVMWIRKFLEDPARTKAVTARARKDIEQKYNTAIMADEYRAIYEAALRGSEARDEEQKTAPAAALKKGKSRAKPVRPSAKEGVRAPEKGVRTRDRKQPVVKILVASHKEYRMPSDSIYLPLQVGAEGKTDENGRPLDLGWQKDNTGDNISTLNPGYCELTGLYWGWKNLRADYVGLVHYRRHFSVSRKSRDPFENILTGKQLRPLLKKYWVIVPQKRYYYIETLYSHYAHTHYAEHLDTTREIIAERFPEYLPSFDRVMKQRYGHMFNMMIMRKDLADQYCAWLFEILFALSDRLGDSMQLSFYQGRFFGRVSEIVLNVWLDYQTSVSAIPRERICELPTIYTERIMWYKKATSFLEAKFFGKKYEGSY